MSDTTIPQNIPPSKPLAMFNQALEHGRLHRLWAKVTRQCFCLLDLDDTLKCSPAESSHYAGIRAVNIDRIRGTQGKADEFDAELNPTQARSRSRWMGVALQKLRGRNLPPVELIQIGDIYYIRDGHHRVSVSRAMGQAFIDAEVTVMHLLPVH